MNFSVFSTISLNFRFLNFRLCPGLPAGAGGGAVRYLLRSSEAACHLLHFAVVSSSAAIARQLPPGR